MSVREAEARWEGDLREGEGVMRLGSGAWEGQYSFRSRFEEGPGTNPEELIGAAHAGCFSMALSGRLTKAGHVAKTIRTRAYVHLESVDGAATITRIVLECDADVPGITEDAFQDLAADAKANCPVSRALAAVEISLEARLTSG